jgi:HD-GYP domain-containing protein (c-di-GMP phosphodiesterase class II)
MTMVAPFIHLVAVGAAGALAAGAAIALSTVATRRNDGRGVLLGFAFSVMAVLLVIHALATPDVLLGENGLVQIAGALNVPIGGAILAASALPPLRRPHRARRLLLTQLVAIALLAATGALLLARPRALPVFPRPTGLESALIFAAGGACLGLLSWRAGRTYLLTRRASDLLVMTGIVWLASAEYGLLHFGMSTMHGMGYGMPAAWWVAHALEVLGIALVGIPAALDLRFGIASRPLVGDLRPSVLVAHEEAFLGPRVHAMLARLAAKDRSTEGHTRRVAMLAVEIGELLGLPERRLRLLALGGLLHDVGKLSVPIAILNKPGKLTDEEFAVIRRHPVWGRELLSELGGFPPLVLRLVESHHERLDGQGYPSNASAPELELEVRILTVADVFDALTADRVYREAWSTERALALLDADTGSAFDATCVRALRAIVAEHAGAPARRNERLAA